MTIREALRVISGRVDTVYLCTKDLVGPSHRKAFKEGEVYWGGAGEALNEQGQPHIFGSEWDQYMVMLGTVGGDNR